MGATDSEVEDQNNDKSSVGFLAKAQQALQQALQVQQAEKTELTRATQANLSLQQEVALLKRDKENLETQLNEERKKGKNVSEKVSKLEEALQAEKNEHDATVKEKLLQEENLRYELDKVKQEKDRAYTALHGKYEKDIKVADDRTKKAIEAAKRTVDAVESVEAARETLNELEEAPVRSPVRAQK